MSKMRLRACSKALKVEPHSSFLVGKMRECNFYSHFGHSKMSGQGSAKVHLLYQIKAK